MEPKLQLTETIYVIAFSVYGSIAHTLMANRATDKKGPALIALLVVNSVIASFAGLMAFFMAQKMGFAGTEVYLLVGMAGFMGGKFLELVELRILSKMEGKKNDSSSG